jgi:putative cardiolipin synthase
MGGAEPPPAMSSFTPAFAAALPAPRTLGAICQRLIRAAMAALALLLATGCAALPDSVSRPPSTALGGAGTALQRIADTSLAGQDPAQSGLRLLPNGDHALDARLALVQRAERSLDLQYYAWHDDDTGRRLLAALRDAGRRGVRVRLLVDDLHAGALQPLLAGLAAHAGVEVRLFNPLPVREGSLAGRVLGSLHDFSRLNHRMHNKLFIADGALAVAGGRNIGDEYFMRSAVANFVDLDVLVAGPVVADMAASFDRYWNSERAWPVQALATPADAAALRAQFDGAVAGAASALRVDARDRLGRSPVSAQLDAGRLDLLAAPVRLLVDAPHRQRCDAADADAPAAAAACAQAEPGAVDALFAAMRETRHALAITSPYFVPGADGMAMLQAVAGRGASIRLLTNSIGATDEPLVHWGYARYRPAMLELGLQIRELSPTLPARTQAFGSFGRSAARLHAKVVVIDGHRVALGSANMDHRSARINTEMVLLIDSPALAAELARLASAEALAGSYRLRLGADRRIEWMVSDGGTEQAVSEEPDLGWTQRLKLGLLSLWIAEDQL